MVGGWYTSVHMILTCRTNPTNWCEDDWSECLAGINLTPYQDDALMTAFRIHKDYKLIQEFQEYYDQNCVDSDLIEFQLEPSRTPEWVCFECKEFEKIEDKPEPDQEQKVKDALSWLVGKAKLYPEIIEKTGRFVMTGNGGC